MGFLRRRRRGANFRLRGRRLLCGRRSGRNYRLRGGGGSPPNRASPGYSPARLCVLPPRWGCAQCRGPHRTTSARKITDASNPVTPIQIKRAPTSVGPCRAGSRPFSDMAPHLLRHPWHQRRTERQRSRNSDHAEHRQHVDDAEALSGCGHHQPPVADDLAQYEQGCDAADPPPRPLHLGRQKGNCPQSLRKVVYGSGAADMSTSCAREIVRAHEQTLFRYCHPIPSIG